MKIQIVEIIKKGLPPFGKAVQLTNTHSKILFRGLSDHIPRVGDFLYVPQNTITYIVDKVIFDFAEPVIYQGLETYSNHSCTIQVKKEE